jgi:hypothetical protein
MTGLPRLSEPPFRRAVPTTPADRAGARVDCFPAHTVFPKWQEGRHPHCHFRGLLRLHSRYGPPDRSATQGDFCHEAPAQPVTRPSRSSASGPIELCRPTTPTHAIRTLAMRDGYLVATARRRRGSRTLVRYRWHRARQRGRAGRGSPQVSDRVSFPTSLSSHCSCAFSGEGLAGAGFRRHASRSAQPIEPSKGASWAHARPSAGPLPPQPSKPHVRASL